ncbi:MAG TPA: hypothetical protein DCE42_11030 [Myxococcales bacterium]|nr:hypothetical protein [Myxococcales bacterium]
MTRLLAFEVQHLSWKTSKNTCFRPSVLNSSTIRAFENTSRCDSCASGSTTQYHSSKLTETQNSVKNQHVLDVRIHLDHGGQE